MSLHLTIPKPCHENWQHMEPNKDGRHCLSCQKTVIDFSLMNDKEILDYVTSSPGELCGRFDPHQLNRGLNEMSTRRKFSWKYVWSLVVAGALWAGKVKAQGGVAVQNAAQEEVLYPLLGIIAYKVPKEALKGKVVNELTGKPVPFASIQVKKGPSTMAIEDGSFSLLKNKRVMGPVTVSAIGYAKQTIRVEDNTGEITIYLVPEAEELQPVEVRSLIGVTGKVNVEHCSVMMGGIISSVKVSKTEKVTRLVNEWFPKKDVVAYPNPLVSGNTMSVALQLKEKGQYRLELIDASGRVMWIQSTNIPSTKYNLSIATQSTWPAGVYWLRITGRHTKNIYNSKIVLE